MKIAVVGTGYVGLVTGTCLAETGNTVTCVDINEEKVKMMQAYKLPIYEPGLDILFHRNIEQGRLKFTTILAEAIQDAQIIFLALPTPPAGDGAADLSFVLGAAKDIAKIITGYKVIVTKSTVPVGTADKVIKVFNENTSVEVDVVSNPEFLREGVAVDDFMKPDRVVVGTQSLRAQKLMAELYGPYVRQGNPIIFMDTRSSELTKYAANSFLATKITFMNEIANLCELVGADVDAVRKGIGSDDRIGKRFLFPGVGYGGSCFPKDVQALGKSAIENNYDFKILASVMEVNDSQRVKLVEKVRKYYNGNIKGKKIAIWGLAFKPETDDIREAPALYIIEELLRDGALITAFDPEAMGNVKKQLADTQVDNRMLKEEVTSEDIAGVVSRWTGVPVTKMIQSEREKLLHMEAELHKRVAGQEEAIEAISDAIRRSRAGLQDKRKPIGSFIFLGTTGVGKTELAKALAEYLFNDEHAMIRIDMSEYQERHAVSRLIGAPPGYVGYDEGGQLTEAVRRKPYSVILLDEIEKAHPDVFNILLQVLDDGRLTDNKGRLVDFKNTIIIMTSNIGSHLIQDNFKDLSEINREDIIAKTKTELFDLLKQTIRPEFLNRIDELIMFTPLNREELRDIVSLQFKGVQNTLAEMGVEIEASEEALDWLAQLGYDPQFGARPLKRVIQKRILNELSKEILSGKIDKDSKIKLDVFDNHFVFLNADNA